MPTSPTDYIGRAVDLHVYQGLQESGLVRTETALAAAGEGGVASVGIAKLGQRFLLELLTERGSQKYAPRRGSTLLTELSRYAYRTPGEVSAAVSRALVDVRKNLVAEERDDDPLDERYGGAQLVSATLAGGRASLSFRLASQDPAAKIILPIAVGLGRVE